MILVNEVYTDIVDQYIISITMNVQQDSDYYHFFNDYIRHICAKMSSALWVMI